MRQCQVDVREHRRIVRARHSDGGEVAADHRSIGPRGTEGHGARAGDRRVARIVIGDGAQGVLPLRRGRRTAGGGQRHRAGGSVPHAGDVAHADIGEGQHVLAVLITTRDGEYDRGVPIVDQREGRHELDGAARSRRVVRLLEAVAVGCRRNLDTHLCRYTGQLAARTLEAIAVDYAGLGVVVLQRRVDGDAAVERVRIARERVGDVVQDVLHRRRIRAGAERHRQRTARHGVSADRHAVEPDIAGVEKQARARIPGTTEDVAGVCAAIADQGQAGIAIVANAVGDQRVEFGIRNAGAVRAQPDGRTADRVLDGARGRVIAPGRDDGARIGQTVTEIDARDYRRAAGRDRVRRVAGHETGFGVLEQHAGRAVRRVDEGFGAAAGGRRGRRQRSRYARRNVGGQQERIGAVHVGGRRRRAGGPAPRQGDALQPRVGGRVRSEILRAQGRADIVPDIALDQAEADRGARGIVVESAACTVGAIALARGSARGPDAIAVVGRAVEVPGCNEGIGVVERRIGHLRRGVCHRLGSIRHRRLIGEALRYAGTERHRGQQRIGAIARGNEQIGSRSSRRQSADRALVAGERIVEVDVIGGRIAGVGKRDLPRDYAGRLIDRLHDLVDGDVGLPHRHSRVSRRQGADRGARIEKGAALITDAVQDDCRELHDSVVLDLRIGVVLNRAKVEGDIATVTRTAGDRSGHQGRGQRLGGGIEANDAAVDLNIGGIAGRIDGGRLHRTIGTGQRHFGSADILQASGNVDDNTDVVVEARGDLHIDPHPHQLAGNGVGRCRRSSRRGRARRIGAVRLVDKHQNGREHTRLHYLRSRHRIGALTRYGARHRRVLGAGRGRVDVQRRIGRQVVVDRCLEREGHRPTSRQPPDRDRPGDIVEVHGGRPRRANRGQAAGYPGQAARQHDGVDEVFSRCGAVVGDGEGISQRLAAMDHRVGIIDRDGLGDSGISLCRRDGGAQRVVVPVQRAGIGQRRIVADGTIVGDLRRDGEGDRAVGVDVGVLDVAEVGRDGPRAGVVVQRQRAAGRHVGPERDGAHGDIGQVLRQHVRERDIAHLPFGEGDGEGVGDRLADDDVVAGRVGIVGARYDLGEGRVVRGDSRTIGDAGSSTADRRRSADEARTIIGARPVQNRARQRERRADGLRAGELQIVSDIEDVVVLGIAPAFEHDRILRAVAAVDMDAGRREEVGRRARKGERVAVAARDLEIRDVCGAVTRRQRATHDDVVGGVTADILDRLNDTHGIEAVGARDVLIENVAACDRAGDRAREDVGIAGRLERRRRIRRRAAGVAGIGRTAFRRAGIADQRHHAGLGDQARLQHGLLANRRVGHARAGRAGIGGLRLARQREPVGEGLIRRLYGELHRNLLTAGIARTVVGAEVEADDVADRVDGHRRRAARRVAEHREGIDVGAVAGRHRRQVVDRQRQEGLEIEIAVVPLRKIVRHRIGDGLAGLHVHRIAGIDGRATDLDDLHLYVAGRNLVGGRRTVGLVGGHRAGNVAGYLGGCRNGVGRRIAFPKAHATVDVGVAIEDLGIEGNGSFGASRRALKYRAAAGLCRQQAANVEGNLRLAAGVPRQVVPGGRRTGRRNGLAVVDRHAVGDGAEIDADRCRTVADNGQHGRHARQQGHAIAQNVFELELAQVEIVRDLELGGVRDDIARREAGRSRRIFGVNRAADLDRERLGRKGRIETVAAAADRLGANIEGASGGRPAVRGVGIGRVQGDRRGIAGAGRNDLTAADRSLRNEDRDIDRLRCRHRCIAHGERTARAAGRGRDFRNTATRNGNRAASVLDVVGKLDREGQVVDRRTADDRRRLERDQVIAGMARA